MSEKAEIFSILTGKRMVDTKKCKTCRYNVGTCNDKNEIYCDKFGEKNKNSTCEKYEWELYSLQSWSFNGNIKKN